MSHLARFIRTHAVEVAFVVLAAALIVAATVALVDVLAFDWPPAPAAAPETSIELAG